MINTNIENALQGLMQKYEIKPVPDLNLLPGWLFLKKRLISNDVPLLPWRANRRFIELQKLVSDKVVENVSMLRFCSFGSVEEWSMDALMYREFDLCEFISSSNVISLHATFSNNSAGNIIVKLANGAIGSIEISTQYPVKSRLFERHEIITRRGIASDIVVDTQIPQYSVYTFTDKGELQYKDIDNELFGMGETEVEYIRAAFDVHKNPKQSKELIKQHSQLSRLVDAAIESNFKKQKIELK